MCGTGFGLRLLYYYFFCHLKRRCALNPRIVECVLFEAFGQSQVMCAWRLAENRHTGYVVFNLLTYIYIYIYIYPHISSTYDVVWCDVIWCDVMWCDGMGWDGIWCDSTWVMWCDVMCGCKMWGEPQCALCMQDWAWPHQMYFLSNQSLPAHPALAFAALKRWWEGGLTGRQ